MSYEVKFTLTCSCGSTNFNVVIEEKGLNERQAIKCADCKKSWPVEIFSLDYHEKPFKYKK